MFVGWDLVADDLGGFGRRGLDRLAKFRERRPHIFRKRREVVVYGLRRRVRLRGLSSSSSSCFSYEKSSLVVVTRSEIVWLLG